MNQWIHELINYIPKCNLLCHSYKNLMLHHDSTRVLLKSALTESPVNKLNNPTCFPASMCVFSSVACVRFINSRAALKAPPGRKRDIHWSNETLFWAFTFTLFYGDLCVCAGFTRSLERSNFSQPASGGFYFLPLLFSMLKLPPGFKVALWGGSEGVAGWQCYHKTVQEMSDCYSASKQICATVLSPCSQTAAATPESTCGGISVRCWIRY